MLTIGNGSNELKNRTLSRLRNGGATCLKNQWTADRSRQNKSLVKSSSTPSDADAEGLTQRFTKSLGNRAFGHTRSRSGTAESSTESNAPSTSKEDSPTPRSGGHKDTGALFYANCYRKKFMV